MRKVETNVSSLSYVGEPVNLLLLLCLTQSRHVWVAGASLSSLRRAGARGPLESHCFIQGAACQVLLPIIHSSSPPHITSPLCLFLHSKPNLLFAREAHCRTLLLLMAWSWMQDALHIQTALTSVMLIACLSCRPLLPIISDGLLA